MPKRKTELWELFQRMEKYPGNNLYYYARCKYCDPEGINLLQGRPRTMENHLKKCKEYLNAVEAEEKSIECLSSVSQQQQSQASTVSTATTTKRAAPPSSSSSLTHIKKAKKKLSIKTFLDRDMTSYEEKIMLQRMIEMVADNGIAFQWIERESTIRFIESLRPSAIKLLPSRRVLGGKLLRDAAIGSRNDRLPQMINLFKDGCNANFICDGWEDGSKTHILGCIVQVLDNWISYDEALGEGNIITQDEHHGIATARMIESAFLKVANDLGIVIKCVITDDAGQCQRAKRILSLRFPQMYFGKCYAHQINLVVKDVFKIIHVQLVSRVKALIKTYNKSASKWLVRLAERSKKLYGRAPSLLRIMDVRWNSTQAAFASVLRIRTALTLINAEYGNVNDFPSNIKVDDAFFEELLEAEKVLRPLTKASFLMQRDCNTLADVLNMFGLLYQSFGKAPRAMELQSLLEKRWEQQEQPLFVLAFMFHPKYVSLFRSMSRFDGKLAIAKILQYCTLYYKKFIGDLTEDEANQLCVEINDWYQDAISDAMFLKCLTPIQFWNGLKANYPFVARLAIFILTIVVQTATCERLFSAFGLFATKKRNKLHSKKVHYLAQVKRSVATEGEKKQNRDSTTRSRLISSAELPRIDTREHEESEESDSDFEVVYADNVDDEEADDTEETNVAEQWDSVFNELERIDEEEYVESLHFLDRAADKRLMTEVLNLEYSDGADHRQCYPYPDNNDTNFPQYKLKGIRAVKFSLEALFPERIEALDEFNII